MPVHRALAEVGLAAEDALAHWGLSESYARQGREKEWVEEVGKIATLYGFPEIGDRVQRAFANSGYTGALRQWALEAEHLIANKRGYFPGVLAETYTALGNKDRAFYWLEPGCGHYHQALADPVLQWIKVDPGFVALRSDARFKDVLRCMGLPE